MPESFTTIIAPVVLLRTIPPVTGVGGASLINSMFWPVVCNTMFCPGGMAGGAVAKIGTSATKPQNPPLQIGWSGSPCSNSIQTCEPMGGTMKQPAWMPAAGTQGIAQLEGVIP